MSGGKAQSSSSAKKGVRDTSKTTAFVLSGGAALGVIQVRMLEAVPLRVIATDVLRGEEVRLSRGPLVAAIMASAAIPCVFPSVEWEGRRLIDGGVSNNAPLSRALAIGADRIYVLPTGAPCELNAPPRGALPMLLYATSLLIGHRLQPELAHLSSDAKVVVLPPSFPLAVQPTDFSHAGELINRARRDAERHLQAHDAPSRRLRGPHTVRARSAASRRPAGHERRPKA